MHHEKYMLLVLGKGVFKSILYREINEEEHLLNSDLRASPAKRSSFVQVFLMMRVTGPLQITLIINLTCYREGSLNLAHLLHSLFCSKGGPCRFTKVSVMINLSETVYILKLLGVYSGIRTMILQLETFDCCF